MKIVDLLAANRSTLYIIIVGAAFLRIALIAAIDPYGSDTVDGLDYHNHAILLLNGEDYPARGSLPFMRPPLYPILLSFVYYFIPHDSYVTARLVNAVLDVATCFVFYKLVLLIWNNNKIALLTSLVYAVNPLILFFSSRVRVESLFSLLLVCFVYIFIKSYKTQFPNVIWIFVSGLLIGMATLTRPNALLVIGLIPLWIFFVNWQNKTKAIRIILCFILGCGITILPWTARNYHRYGEFILVNDAFGYSFWISNSELKVEDLKAKTHLEYLNADKRLWEETAATERTLEGKSLIERQNHYTSLGLQYIRNNLSDWVLLNMGKFLEFWSPMGRIDMQGWKAILTLPFGVLMLIGLFSFVSKVIYGTFDRNIWLFFAILIVSATISGVMNWSSIRYRIPMVDAYLMPFTFGWLLDRRQKVSE